jgi:hypothetical protein
MRYSIVIPLEFHRGIASQCIAGWTQGQRYPADQFELLIAAPQHAASDGLDWVHGLLRGNDRVYIFPHQHDMPLVAEAAKLAKGQYLVFTESHCLPNGDFLQRSDDVLRDHPEWSGFSGGSIPWTHNLLSEIEASMYATDINDHLQNHPWLKVLDQCFVVNRNHYQSVGGIEPQYGHFAEWLIAARLFRSKKTIGYDSRASISHYYCGDLEELKAFTVDFAAGRIRFASVAATDPCGDLFEEEPAWTKRHHGQPYAARWMTKLLVRDWLRCVTHRHGRSRVKQIRQWPYKTAFQWLRRSLKSTKQSTQKTQRSIDRLTQQTQLALQANQRDRAQHLFLELMKACQLLGSQQFLISDHQRTTTGSAKPTSFRSEFVDVHHGGSSWTAGHLEPYPTIGMHSVEQHQRVNFRWAEPAAMIGLPPLQGDWVIHLQWIDAVDQPTQQRVRFYLDQKPISPDCIEHVSGSSKLRLNNLDGSKPHRLAWVSDCRRSPQDVRDLGMPLARVTWEERSEFDASVHWPSGSRNQAVIDPIYFLHVPKCAGTSTRLTISNAFAAHLTLAQHSVRFYYANQLDHESLDRPVSFAAGHFGWELIKRLPDRRWRIVTVARSPLDRLHSQYVYLNQQRQLPRELSFEQWIESALLAADLQVPYFLPDTLLNLDQGIDACAQAVAHRLDEAIANLDRCEAVGIQSDLDDSLLLLCHHLDLLPPRQSPRVNVTLDRQTQFAPSIAAQKRFSDLLGFEETFYQHAVDRYQQQRLAMFQSLREQSQLPLATSDDLRSYLRQQYFARHSTSVERQAPFDRWTWSADESILAFNFHDRERHQGRSLRWTGPSGSTTFYAPIASDRPVTLECRLHPATPPSHAQQTKVSINGMPASVKVNATADGWQLIADAAATRPAPQHGLFSEIILETPTVREANQFRSIGIAVTAIHIRSAAATRSIASDTCSPADHHASNGIARHAA